MLTSLGVEATAVVAAALHHVSDGTGMSLWSVAGGWHILTTVVMPTALIVLSCVVTFLTAHSPGWRPPADDRNGRAILAFWNDDTSGSSDSGHDRWSTEQRRGERSAEHAVAQFYRVTFVDERGFRLWTERVVELAAVVRDLLPDRPDARPVIFLPLRPTAGTELHAYVSAGARALTAHLSGGAKIDPEPIGAEHLPRGLTMLFGDGIDAAEYEKRQT